MASDRVDACLASLDAKARYGARVRDKEMAAEAIAVIESLRAPTLTDEQLTAANLAYTEILFPESSPAALLAEWERWGEYNRRNARRAMQAAILAALRYRPKGGATT